MEGEKPPAVAAETAVQVITNEVADGGMTGWTKRLAQLGVISALVVFFGGALWAYRSDMRQVIEWHREDVAKIIATHERTSEKMWQSLNTTNHATAGAVNTMEKLLQAVQNLQQDVKALNKVAGRFPVEIRDVGAQPPP